jgi:ApaG protein
MMYEKTTHNISIQVTPDFLPDQSRPEDEHYVWSYHVRIENKGDQIVQLKSRYWKITDAFGHSHEVEGEGVIGQQPTLAPGESFEYTSGTPLPTPGGIMTGTYKMLGIHGQSFTVDIPAFSLDSPYQRAIIH